MRAFLDTNILLYDLDSRDNVRQPIAGRLIAKLGGSAVISTQVLQEFFNGAVKKMGLSAEHAQTLTQIHARLQVVDSNTALVLSAIEISIESQVSIWDALIIRAAEVSGCKVLYSEDMNHGQDIRGVRIENPFV